MNICIAVISDGWGGAETVVFELARSLIDRGNKVFIISNTEMLPYYADLDLAGHLDIGSWYVSLTHRLDATRARRRNTVLRGGLEIVSEYLLELRRFWSAAALKGVVRRFIEENEIELVNCHMVEADIFISRTLHPRTPVVSTVHGEHALMGSQPVGLPWKPIALVKGFLFKSALVKSRWVSTVSEAELDKLVEWLPSISHRLVMIHNGIDLAEYQPARVGKLELKGEFKMVFPGGAKWSKGWDLLIAAVTIARERMHDFHLYVALDVSLGHQMRAVLRESQLEGRITFCGFLPKDRYRVLLNSVDVLVMPSRVEAFPVSILEAMALGKPIIATAVGGIPEVVLNGRNGVLVDPDPNQIAEAMVRLCTDNRIRSQMSQSNLEDIVVYDWTHITPLYEEIFHKAIVSE